jgi:hypothetical protein
VYNWYVNQNISHYHEPDPKPKRKELNNADKRGIQTNEGNCAQGISLV